MPNAIADEHLQSGKDSIKSEKKWRPFIIGGAIALLYAFVNSVVTSYHLMTGTGDYVFRDINAMNISATVLLVLFSNRKTVVNFLIAYISMLIIASLLFGVVGLLFFLPALVPITLTSGGVIAIREIYEAGMRRFSK